MADLTAAQRKRLPASKFAEPKQRKYPVPDKAHAKNAKARASAAYRSGRMTKAERDRIYAKSDVVLYGGQRGRDHVYLVDEKGGARSNLKPDNQPQYKIKPEGVRRKRGSKPTT